MTWREFLIAAELQWRVSPTRVQALLSQGYGTVEEMCEEARSLSFSAWWEKVFETSIAVEYLERWTQFFLWLQKLEAEKLLSSLQVVLDWQERYQVTLTTRFDSDFPTRLQMIPFPPTLLWWTRPPSFSKDLPIAVVGSRDMSEYGAKATRVFVRELVKTYNATVISGCARGIDLVAHEAAIASGGETVGFLGSGILSCPERTKKIMERGWVASEFLPNVPVRAWHFEQRNRLIAGLAEAVVIMEAGLASGTLITASAAIDQGKTVFVMGQPFTGTKREGVKALLEKGATHIFSAEELITKLRTGKEVVSPYRVFDEVLTKADDEDQRFLINFLWRNEGKWIVHELPAEYEKREKIWKQTLYILQAKGIIVQQAGVVALSCMIQS